MNGFDYVATAVYLTALGLALRWILRHLPGGRAPRPQLPYRSRADVLRNAAEHRARLDLEQMHAIWPDPPSARVIETQHRLDTAKQRKEEGQ